MKTCPLRTELFHADGRTDMAKLIAHFRSFANAPKKPAKVISESTHTLLWFSCEMIEQ
jgi:hypothetical protein